MKIAICDDELIFLHKLEKMIKNISVKFDISIYDKPENLLCTLNKCQLFDIYVLDIEMPEINGMELAKTIRQQSKKTIIIFLTSYEHYVYEAFEINIFRYIRKTHIDEELYPALNAAYSEINNRNDTNYYICSQKNISEKIFINNIDYICKIEKNINIYLIDGTKKEERKNISDIYNELRSDKFIYSDRGTLVNIENIDKIEKNKITLITGQVIYISRYRIKTFTEEVLKYWRDRI